MSEVERFDPVRTSFRLAVSPGRLRQTTSALNNGSLLASTGKAPAAATDPRPTWSGAYTAP